MTGDPLGRGFPGAMTMMVVRSLVSNAAHTIGRNGGSQRSGSGNPKPNAPTGPRTGGGNTSNVNAPSYANGYHHSASAQQNSANPAFNQESISAQTVAAQTDTVQSAAEKMAGAFPQAAPAGTGKQPNSTRKTAVPPGIRRAPGHVAAPKNHAAPTAAKTSPGAPYHRADTSQPIMGGAGTQNTQQEQSVDSQSESHPRSSASVQNHAGVVSFGAAGKRQVKIRCAVPISRPVPQESPITAATHRGRRYRPSPHSSAAPLCSRLIHNAERPEWQLLQMQCRTILFCRLPLRAARHNLSAAQECQTIRTAARYEIRKQNPFSSAVPLCKLQTWQARSQQQNIRLLLPLRDPVWQETRLRRISVCSQHLHQTVRQENSQLPIRQMPPVLH